jgi:hypothetical protein
VVKNLIQRQTTTNKDKKSGKNLSVFPWLLVGCYGVGCSTWSTIKVLACVKDVELGPISKKSVSYGF